MPTAIVTLSWDAVDDADGYRIYRDDTSGVPADETNERGQTTDTTFDDEADFDSTFYYAVTAFDSDGESGPSNELEVAIGSAPNFEVVITGTNTPVDAGEVLTVDIDVTNTGDYDFEQDVTLTVEEQ